MFYTTFRLRHQKEYCSPRGPDFSRAKKIQFSVDDSKITLRVPKHQTRRSPKPTNPKKAYQLSELRLPEFTANEPHWKGLPLIVRTWDFYGPLFTGKKATIRMRLAIISPRDIKQEVSFFHPRAFENGLADFLTYLYGKELSLDNEQCWYAPVNWQPLPKFPCVAAKLDIGANKEANRDVAEHCLFFPVSPHHMIALFCYVSRNLVFIKDDYTAERDTDKWIDKAPMEKLASQVIESVQVQLSPKALEQQKKALQGLGDTSLVKKFPPIRWS